MKQKKQKEYISIYISERGKKDRDLAEEGLDDVDCNFSRILGILFIPIYKICKIIVTIGKNYRHFKWNIIIYDRASGNYYCSDDNLQIRRRK